MSDETQWDDSDGETQWDDEDVTDEQIKLAPGVKTDGSDNTSVSIKEEPNILKPTITRESYDVIAARNAQKRYEFYCKLDALEMKALDLMKQEINVEAGIASMSGQFTVGGTVDLNKLVAFAPNAELDKRKRPNVHIRLRHPHCSAQVNPSGFVSILGSKSRSELYSAARKVAYLVKHSGGYEDAKLQDFLINNIVMSCRTPDQRKCDHVEAQLRSLGYEASLDQEIFPCVRVVLEYPRTHSCKVFRTGALIFMGLKSVTDCITSIKYFVHVLRNLPSIAADTGKTYGQYTVNLDDDDDDDEDKRVQIDVNPEGVREEDDFTLEHPEDP